MEMGRQPHRVRAFGIIESQITEVLLTLTTAGSGTVAGRMHRFMVAMVR